MFEVDPNLWLQSFHSQLLYGVLHAVTALGYDWFYIALIVLLGFGVRLRPTLSVMLALLLAGLVTHAAKTGFEMPRPTDVDAHVLYKGEPHVPLIANGGADGFFSLPSPDARAAVRALPDPDYGFISGHVSAAAALCLGLLLSFRIKKRWLWIALCTWPILMAVSRMYLGRHFLGDAVGGWVAGTLMALLVAWLLPIDTPAKTSSPRLGLLAIATVALCVLAPFTSLINPSEVGKLAGLVVVLAVLGWQGFPEDGGTLAQRVGRIGCLCIAYATVELAVQGLAGMTGWEDDSLAWLPVAAVATAAMFLGGVALATRLGLFRVATIGAMHR